MKLPIWGLTGILVVCGCGASSIAFARDPFTLVPVSEDRGLWISSEVALCCALPCGFEFDAKRPQSCSERCKGQSCRFLGDRPDRRCK